MDKPTSDTSSAQTEHAKEQAGTHALGATLGALGGAAVGVICGIGFGPIGSLAGGVAGAVIGGLLAAATGTKPRP